ncbi:MAG: MFS transporter [Bacteroidales bacterium OttesenSCG-928-I14]|jgi:POT family proton-dependent oligopeptide transporter|nr:MFS transporter [Bacteroidales bacterium OttesenSCG-928-I14]
MFRNHPIGLYTLSFTNTCERFGHYIVLAIFTLFLQVKFGFSVAYTSTIIGIFLSFVYFTPILGGIIADKFLGYRKTIKIGIFVMFIGYLLLALCVKFLWRKNIVLFFVMFALFIISIGIGFFKGNLQVLVGNLYDNKQYRTQRDNAYSIYYMSLNIGTLFAPTVAKKITDFVLYGSGLFYNAKIPVLAHQFINKTINPVGVIELTNLAVVHPIRIANLFTFSKFYVDNLSESYGCVFWMACFVHICLMIIYFFSRRTYENINCHLKQFSFSSDQGMKILLTQKQIKKKIIALVQVYFIVIFFWMSFDQNLLTLTFFARDYVVNEVKGFNRIEFDVISLSLIALSIYSLIGIFKSKNKKWKLIFIIALIITVMLIVFKYNCNMNSKISIRPELFQQFNPFFVIILTPIFVCLFDFLAKKEKEPSAPCKIGIAMIIASLGYAILAIGSFDLPSPSELMNFGGISNTLLSPNWLVIIYFFLTSAELLLSPIGISFVSKVAPIQYKGLLMGGWFASTAIGGYLVSFIGYLWGNMQLWKVWGVIVACCLSSAIYTFSIIKKLENASK